MKEKIFNTKFLNSSLIGIMTITFLLFLLCFLPFSIENGRVYYYNIEYPEVLYCYLIAIGFSLLAITFLFYHWHRPFKLLKHSIVTLILASFVTGFCIAGVSLVHHSVINGLTYDKMKLYFWYYLFLILYILFLLLYLFFLMSNIVIILLTPKEKSQRAMKNERERARRIAVRKLTDLSKLLSCGAITQEEFDEKKKELMPDL